MSRFSAINVSDDESDAEEHTRELQIEESLKLFKKALNQQKDKNFDDAFETYQQLFKIDVISDFSPSSYTVSNLRYLSYRNRGFLKLDKLINDQQKRQAPQAPQLEADGPADLVADAPDSDFLDELYDDAMSCIEDLVTSLVFGEGDTKLVELIYEFFTFFGNQRLTRYILEYELMKNDISMGNDSNLLLIRRNKVSTTFSVFLNRYEALLKRLNDFDSVVANPDTFINRNNITVTPQHDSAPLRDLSFLQPLKDEILANQHKNLHVPKELEVDFSKHRQLTISVVLREVQHVLPRPKTRLKRFFDHYYSTDEPIEKLTFKTPTVEEKEALVKSEEAAVETDLTPESDIVQLDDDNDIGPITEADDQSPVDEKTPEGETSVKKDEKEKEHERKRSSRRLNAAAAEEPVTIESLDFSVQSRFFTTINQYLELLPEKLTFDDVVGVVKSPESTQDPELSHFMKILETWNHSKSEQLLFNAAASKKSFGVMEILNADASSESFEADIPNMDECDLSELVDSIADSTLHYHQARIKIVEFVLQYRNGNSLIIDFKLDKEPYQDLKHFISCSDILLYSSIKDSLQESKNIGITLAIFEILVDSYVAIYAELEQLKSVETQKNSPAELVMQKKILVNRIIRWKALLEDLFFYHKDSDAELHLRFEWCDLTYLQHTENLSEANELNIKERLSVLMTKRPLKRLDIQYANYHYIKRLNYKAVSIQLSKLNILTSFSNIFRKDKEEASSENMQLLEKILFPKPRTKKPKEQKDMENFINSSNPELKLKLTQVLLDYFAKTGDHQKFQIHAEHVISMLHTQINNDSQQSTALKYQELIAAVAFFGDLMDSYLDLLSNRDWKLPICDVDTAVLQKLLDLIRLSYAFCLHEEIASQTSLRISLSKKSAKSYQKLVDTAANGFALFFVYFESKLENAKPEYINDLLDILHFELGRRGFCEGGNGKFLKLLQDVLINLGWPESERDILQLINCRYQLQISVDGFTPFDHNTKGTTFTRHNALDISKYVIPICFKKRNPMLNNMRSDIKILLDSIYEAIGDPDDSDEAVVRCTALFDEFLDNTPLSVKVMRDCFYGLQSLDLYPGKLDIQVAIDNGLYFLQGLNALNMFKLRKRSMQSRISELDFVIKMFKQDLFCGSQRLESWFLLGQSYGYLVEDDLIWTSDKLTNDDKKEATALLQKKSLLCYLMAINQLTSSDDKSKYEHIRAQLWSSFGKELYNATMEPMSKLCFEVNGIPNYLKQKSKIVEEAVKNHVSDKTLLKLLKSSFAMAAKFDDKDWVNFYYLAKLEHKTDDDPDLIFEYLLKSIEHAKTGSHHSELVLEPHYLLCSIASKLVATDLVAVEYATGVILQDHVFTNQKSGVLPSDKTSFAKFIIGCLEQIVSLDKKNWHHKPHFRIARIQMDIFHDVAAAKEEMSNLINLKPTVKNLVTIWKPEFERPGKHFCYNYQYVVFYVDLLYESKDLTAILLAGKKLRRYGASIVKILKVWNHTTKRTCDLIRMFADIDDNYSERAISTVPYSQFMQKAKSFNAYLNARGSTFDKPYYQHLFYLFTEFTEIKRMSNGFSQTAYIDDTYYCLYLKMLSIYETEIDSTKEPVVYDSSVKSKLAKKDIAEAIKSLNSPKLPEKTIIYDRSRFETATISEDAIRSEKDAADEGETSNPNGATALKEVTPPVTEAADAADSDNRLINGQNSNSDKRQADSLLPETPTKKQKQEEIETISEEEVFHTPRKTFDENDDDDDDVIQD